MADHTAIAAVSRSLRTLLRDRMTVTTAVTIAPPDVEVAGVEGAHVNLYLYSVLENPQLANQDIPGRASPGAYGRPPLSLDLRYLVTTHSALEAAEDSDLNAQTVLGDAMCVLHFFGNRIDTLTITRPVAGTVGDPILDPALIGEHERVKLTLHPVGLDDLAKIWSALSEENFRRSVIYEVKVVQIETTEPPIRPLPVETRRVSVSLRRRPVLHRVYVTPAAGEPQGEMRVRVGDEITIESEGASGDRVHVRLGGLEPIRLAPRADGRYRIHVPDDQYPPDLDHPASRPILADRRLQPGLLEVQLVAIHAAEAVRGGLDRGTTETVDRRSASNVALMQLVPRIAALNADHGDANTVLQLQGNRLWREGARDVLALVGDAVVRVRRPAGTDPWSAPTPTSVEIPIAEAAAQLPAPSGAGDVYPGAIEMDGARSRDPVQFRLEP